MAASEAGLKTVPARAEQKCPVQTGGGRYRAGGVHSPAQGARGVCLVQ